MDIGFQNAGFDIKACIEIDKSCCATLRKNMPETLVLNRSVVGMSGEWLLSECKIDDGRVDLVFGGPPCQSFSLAGSRTGLDDDRGKLVFEFIRLIKELTPVAFVMENVKAMMTWGGGEVMREIEKEFENPIEVHGQKVSYRIESEVLNAADFGVAQNRHRVFVVGNRVDVEFKHPVGPIMTIRPTVGQILAKLPAACESVRSSVYG